MWFSLFATVLILAVMFYEGLQGLFTALINCILAVLAVALAFGLYEDLYYAFLKEYQPFHGRAIALMAIFILSLLILRTVFDLLIKGNLQFPLYMDRIGGGLFGFITGLLIVGTLSVGFEMLPFGDTVLGFGRFRLRDRDSKEAVPAADVPGKDPSKLEYVRNEQWLRQEAFTVALVSHLSGNALAGRNRFGEVYPDFLASTYRARARMGDEAWLTPEKDFKLDVEGYWDVKPSEFFARQRLEDDNKKVKLVPSKLQPAGGMKRIAVRVRGNGRIEFTREQFRLVVRDAKAGRTTEHLPVGINDDKAGNRLVEIYDGELFNRDLAGGKAKSLMDLVFEVPESASFDEGTFLEYKQNERVPLTPAKALVKNRPGAIGSSGGPTTPRPGDSASAGGNPAFRPGQDRPSSPTQGRVSGLGPARGAEFTDRFLVRLTNYSGTPEVANGELRGGHLYAALDDNWDPIPGDKPPIERLQVAPDMRILQVSLEQLHAGSTLGRARNFAVSTLQDYYVVDQNGQNYWPVGKLAMARVGGKPTLEMIYLDETARQDKGNFQKVPLMDRIRRDDLKGDYLYVFIFQLPVGSKPVKVHTDGRNDVDLTPFNLEAR
ncbi:MAG: CvpA family protein [Phycisphaerae bacterium]|jgi:hypothetical protein